VVIYFNDPDPVEESVDTGPVDAQIEALVEESVEEPVQEPKQGVVREIDLLALQGEDSEFLFQGVQVPAKDYDWIRFYLEPEPGASAPPLSNFATSSFIEFENDYRENLIIPGGLQAGLQLVSGFTVPEDDSVAFTVDFDLRNAIQKDEQFEGYHRMRRALRLVDNSNVGVITGTVDPTLFPSGYTCNENAKICPGLSVVVYAVDSDQNGGDPEEAESEKMQAAAVLEDPLTTANVRYRQVNGSWEYRYTVGFLNVRVLGGQVVGLEPFRREVLQVEGHDQAGAAVNGGGHHMPVIGVRQLDGRDQMLEAGDQAVADVGVHQRPRPLQVFGLQVWPLLQNVTRPLVVDHVRPTRPVQIGQCQAHQQVAQRCRVEHARVVDGRDRSRRQASIGIEWFVIQATGAPGRATHADSWKSQRIDHGTNVVSRTDVMARDFVSGGRVGGDCDHFRWIHRRSRAEPVAGDRRPLRQRDVAGAEIERRQADERLRSRLVDDQHIAAAIGEDDDRLRFHRVSVEDVRIGAVCDAMPVPILQNCGVVKRSTFISRAGVRAL
jgi:hypothetical protein